MTLLHLLSEQCIRLDLSSTDKQDVLAELVDILDQAGKLLDKEAFLQAIQEREASGSTGLQYGVAIPHGRSGSVREAAIAFGIARDGIDFDALDGEPSVFFLLIAEPQAVDSEHLEILAAVCRHLDDGDFRERILQADSAAQVLSLFTAAEQAKPMPPPATESMPMIAAVTSCPVGISHTYLAAERLQDAARRMGITLRVETHGSVGVKGQLSAAEIAQAQAVILAVDRKLDATRFADKPVIDVWVTEAIRRPEALLTRALSQTREATPLSSNMSTANKLIGGLIDLYRHLMNGIAAILPFVIAGGVVISLAAMLGFEGGANASEPTRALAAWLMALGGAQGAFGLLTPVLAGFIGRSIALRPGFMPAMIGGLLLGQGGAGLLGGIVAGFLGGYSMLAIRALLRWLPDEFEAIRAILLYPLLGLCVSGALALLLVTPMAALHQSMLTWLLDLGWLDSVLFGALLGAMMAVDLGGPINKIAYTFGIIAIEMGSYLPAAAIMAAGMVPPLAVGAATWVFVARFNASERRLGKSCLLKGACFVTEGVIPFAAHSLWQVMPACVLGAMLTGALSMVFGCELLVPHGGVLVIPLVKHWALYCVAIASGVSVAVAWVGMLKVP